MGWSWLDKITWVLFMACGLTVGYTTATSNNPIIIVINYVTLFALGYAYKTYCLIKELREELEKTEW